MILLRCAALLLALLVLPATQAHAQEVCPPDTPPTFDASFPTWEQVNGFQLGSRKATTEELYRYLQAAHAAAPDRTVLRSLATSHGGRELLYLTVAAPAEIARLEETAAVMRRLRLAQETPARAAELAAQYPAFAWIASNVHGNEPSGADGSMRLIYELLARTDCFNQSRLQEVVSFFQPTQNPDGREANSRTNAYGFDMNRDWFARSQPETDGKLEAIHHYPPILYIDAHEQGGTAGFFPPNADPIHHEISSTALDHINEVYSPAMREAADEAGYDYTNYTTYDLFAMVYGDTVPSTAFGAAGMTFEKGSTSPYSEKTFEQYTNQWASLNAAVVNKDRLLTEWAAQFREAIEQGRNGELEANITVQPENSVQFPVPQQKVYGYVLRTDAHAAEAARLVQRLRALDVAVYRLTKAANVPGYREFSRLNQTPTATKVPKGSYWIPMAQSQKHWIQALIGEDPYVPFAYFYDVSGWSNIALMGLEAGIATAPPPAKLPIKAVGTQLVDDIPDRRTTAYTFAGDASRSLAMTIALLRDGVSLRRVSASSTTAGGHELARGAIVVPGSVSVPRLRQLSSENQVEVVRLSSGPPDADTVELREPKLAMLGSDGFARFVLDHVLGVDFDVLGAGAVETGALDTGYTAVLVPEGTGTAGLTPLGLVQLQLFVRGGGTFIGFGDQGLNVARAAGLTLALPRPPSADLEVPGTSLAMDVDPGASPLAWGLSERDFAYNTSDPIIEPGTSQGVEVARYSSGADAYQSGYATGTSALQGTPTLLDETVDSGHALLFSFDATFRAWSESGIRLLANGLVYPTASAAAREAASRSARTRGASGLQTGLLSARFPLGRDAVIEVALAEVGTLDALLASGALPQGSRVERDLSVARLRIPNPRGLDVHERTWVPRVFEALTRAGVRPRSIVL